MPTYPLFDGGDKVSPQVLKSIILFEDLLNPFSQPDGVPLFSTVRVQCIESESNYASRWKKAAERGKMSIPHNTSVSIQGFTLLY